MIMEQDQPVGADSPELLFGVEVRHLAALSAIAQTKSFSKAGEQLGYAQSAISQQLAALERAVGHKLVERPGGSALRQLDEADRMRHVRPMIEKGDSPAAQLGRAGRNRR